MLARVSAEARRELRGAGILAGPDAWRGALNADVRRLIAAGKTDEAKRRLVRRLRGVTCA